MLEFLTYGVHSFVLFFSRFFLFVPCIFFCKTADLEFVVPTNKSIFMQFSYCLWLAIPHHFQSRKFDSHKMIQRIKYFILLYRVHSRIHLHTIVVQTFSTKLQIVTKVSFSCHVLVHEGFIYWLSPSVFSYWAFL